MSWRIAESKEVLRLVRKHQIPKAVLGKYEDWKKLVLSQGPQTLTLRPGLRDHALQGRLQGLRTSYLNDQWRVVYLVDQNVLLVTVEQVTAHHYKKERDPSMHPDVRKGTKELFETFRVPQGAKLAQRHILVPTSQTIRNLREFAGLTQKQLAKKAGITETSLSAIENGRIALGTERAKRLARALSVHPAILLFPDWPQ